jgi:AcrR family transcriptional regulator
MTRSPTDERATDAPNRRREVIDAALELLAEHGYAGASLRKVAAKVGVAQPSLYHYFRTKEELVEQVLATYAGDMFGAIDPASLPRRLEEVPRFLVEAVVRVYERPRHPTFVRVAFAVSRANPRFGKLMRNIFVDQSEQGMRLIMRPFLDVYDLEDDEAMMFVRTIIYGMGFYMLERHVLFDDQPVGPAMRQHAEFVVQLGETWVRSRRRRPRTR